MLSLADTTAPNKDGDSILQILVRAGKNKAAWVLINNADPNLEHSNKKSESVLHTIVLQKEDKILSQVIRKGIDISPTMPDQQIEDEKIGGSALHISLALESKKCVEILLSEMSESKLKISGDDETHSALGLALKNQWHDIGEELLTLGASVDQIVNKNSLLVNAISDNDEKSTLFLLGNGADPNILSANGKRND